MARATSTTSVAVLLLASLPAAGAEEVRVPLVFSGGHEIGPRDHGRPVPLIAAALGVKPDVFRKAFDGVRPAKGGRPTRERERSNKEALLRVLAPHGVTNERLDEVSNYYRFRPQEGERWPTAPAKGYAVIEDGAVKRVVVTEPGSGYCSPPKVTAKGTTGVTFAVTLRFGKDLKKNGGVATVKVAPAKPAKTDAAR